MKFEKSCGSIVFFDDKVLIVKHNEGHWDFPKGHMEYGEEEVETAIREVKEETNIDIEVDNNYRYVISYNPKEGVLKEVVFFLGKAKNSNVISQEEEVSLVKFVTINEAYEILTHDLAKEVLTKVLNDMNK